MWTSLDAPSDRDYYQACEPDPPDACPVCGAVDDEPHYPECGLVRKREQRLA